MRTLHPRVRPHLTRRIWDAVTSIATDGSMEGVMDIQATHETGYMFFDVDAQKFKITVERIFP